MEAKLKTFFAEFGLSIEKEKIQLFERYYRLLISENEKYNLTAVTGEDEVIVKHFLDSTAVLIYRDLTDLNAVDIGTGAGFPGIPLKIMVPGLKLLLLDSLKKRCLFLERVVRELNLTNVTVINERAENLGRQKPFRELFDVTFSRAVAEVRVLLEFHAPLLRLGGETILFKGPGVDEELKKAEKAAKQLGMELKDVYYYRLPGNFGERSLVVYKKLQNTPENYPRRPGIPEKRPL
ncbi:16S rRNA (guanine(527)-N(7))-methyltransferase RsmG [Carboxydothermus hydrogenoformans]|uniref:Ribosomal RNA small subunit methyltransferase G n=1 Tax=Carboxydothermus hydrogenoformans (strain ATCC BAA-161 / DSM 6008 / Z-2901) TaxID=246194 RepID=RSMG_CARHZ|nr:16S rRNA (guanine(527)-N(7))-methyltransferase RsmG [Carboxydothermus hydrogenoformans]Q3AG54.1 RecName: Full=Ribosomal RNA small subunit methyltransferase G; AltName: Full=16S rRNA 7-methylguanosine methyltransferase; Short=16S rRNA m7G methyltransferase [Carboxydothermus hydrogenoformans Z-2901]ABB15853.1 glucose-inhibited division protein B [Carboxydothermus hydrogenoformans Z-2901]